MNEKQSFSANKQSFSANKQSLRSSSGKNRTAGLKIAVILPMYNEEDNAPLILEHLSQVAKKNNLDLSPVAVNDGSRDATLQVLSKLAKSYKNLHIVTYKKNRGMGGALQVGIKYAKNKGFEILVFMDSDLTHDSNDIPKFLKKVSQGYDLVLGSRFIKGGKMVGVPFLRQLISKIGNFIGKIILRTGVNDLTTGYRVAKSDVFDKIILTEKGFAIQLEETVKALAVDFRITEVPITLTTRRFGSSKMIYSVDLASKYFKLLGKCFTWRYNPHI